MPVNFDKECFFIAPIGPDDSDIRKRSDGVRDLVVREAAEAHELETRRADDVDEPGQITSQIIEHCLKAKMVVADLTEGNANVYYELSVRHGKQLPAVLIAEHGTRLPFDVGQARVIFFAHDDLSSAIGARETVKQQIGAALESPGPFENPISSGMRLAELEAGDPSHRALASVMERLDRVAGVTNEVNGRLQTLEEAVSPFQPRRRWADLRGAPQNSQEISKSPESFDIDSLSGASRREVSEVLEKVINRLEKVQSEASSLGGEEDPQTD
jgi:hypothetical protein